MEREKRNWDTVCVCQGPALKHVTYFDAQLTLSQVICHYQCPPGSSAVCLVHPLLVIGMIMNTYVYLSDCVHVHTSTTVCYCTSVLSSMRG